jgi:hypothetical protein
LANYPSIPLSVVEIRSSSTARRRNLRFVRIGGVAFYCADGNLVLRAAALGEDYYVDDQDIHVLFPHKKINYTVSQTEIRFHLVRLLGEQAFKIVLPMVDNLIGED